MVFVGLVLIWLSIATFLASVVGTFTGFGVSTILIPVFLLFFPVPETLLIVGVIHWFGNVWKLILFREGIEYRLILLFGIPGVILSYTGAVMSLEVPQTILSRAIGLLIISYVLFIYFKPDYELPENRKSALVGGALYGFSSGISGIGGELRSMFLTSFNLPKAVYLATTGAISLTIDSTRIVTYVAGGTRLQIDMVIILIGLVLLSSIGAYIGKRFVEKVPKRKFRLVVLISLLLISLKLLIFP